MGDGAAVLETVAELKRRGDFGEARKLLERAHQEGVADPDQRETIVEQWALCTYKDKKLGKDDRLQKSFNILEQHADLARCTDPETLGIAGAIHKRMWEVDTQKRHLEKALFYYSRGYKSGLHTGDFGYPGINAAFLCDLLAFLEEREGEGPGSEIVAARKDQARQIREYIVLHLPTPEAPDWWHYATLGEACFGLDKFDEAGRWIERGLGLAGQEDWMQESTARQLVKLAWVKGIPLQNEAPAARVLLLMARDAAVLSSLRIGKVGLALSGGGFRASLFHLGVMARLAELDILRHIEVLSCVSGGSIVGAHYHLRLKEKLESAATLSRQDYIDLVSEVTRSFLAGVRRNLRVRLAANLIDNVRMIFGRRSRTERLGELMERELFGATPLRIADQTVSPKGPPQNWRRSDKVPMLVLNASTLNTGHNWQFTTQWMGEPPLLPLEEVSTNERFRRVPYQKAPGRYKDFLLGHAVAASACVPGLLEPISLDDLYPNGRTVELVDGGVYDNQGCSCLLEKDCDVVLVSDASGQMGTMPAPKDSILPVLGRTMSVLMDRVRGAQYQELVARQRGGLLRGKMFLHLKLDLVDDPLDWIGCDVPTERAATEQEEEETYYGIRKDIQRALADLRTDLDAFSDTEAFSLMISGYRMCTSAFEGGVGELPRTSGDVADWIFRDPDLENAMTGEDEAQHKRVMKLLEMGESSLKKERWLRVVGPVVIVCLFLAVFYYGIRNPTIPLLTLGGLAWTLAGLILAALVGKTMISVLNWQSTLRGIAAKLAIAFSGWVLAWVQLQFFDPAFLKRGRCRRSSRPA